MAPLSVYKSSAGSGKTFTLVKFYLELVLQDPSRYKNILAVTFTNKATWEMKERILETLKSLAKDESSTMREVLEATFQSKEVTIDISRQADKVLKNILHDYSRFAVSTIDSFFHRVIRAFSRELGLSVNFELETDQAQVLREVTDLLMLDIGKDKQLTNWLRDFAFDKMEDDQDWNVQRDIENLGRELFQEQFQKIQDQLYREDQSLQKSLGDFIKELDQFTYSFKNSLKGYAKDVLKQVKEYNLEPEDFSGGSRSIVTNFQKFLEDEDVERMESFLKKFQRLESPEKLSSQKSEKRQAIIQCGEEGLFDILETSADYIEKHHAQYETIRAIKSNAYAFGILADLSDQLREYRREHELLMIPDMNHLLKRITTNTDSPFIYEKVGYQFRHFLLDEFQDTSDFQWDNLRPLLINSLSANQDNLIVGDVKQSIYRWRGGNPDMLVNRLYEDLGEFRELVQDEQLNTNFRSFGNLVRFNNQFFQHATQALEQVEGLKEPEFVQSAYKDVVQSTLPELQKGGYIYINFFSKDKANNPDDHAREQIITTVQDLLSRGFNYRDIAILVRTNGQAKDTARFLSSPDYQYPVISSDSLVVEHSTKVRFLVNLFYYLNDPQSSLIKTFLLNDYIRYLTTDQNWNNHEVFSGWQEKDILRNAFPESFFRQWEYLRRLPLYELGETLVRIFKLDDSNDAYLQRFLDLLLDFSKRQRSDITHFLEWWEDKGRKEAVQVPAGENAIRIETIHKAKGLEYPVVLMPYTYWSLGHGGSPGSNFLWVQPQHEPFMRFPYLPVNYTASLDKTLFQEDYQQELMLSYLDNLNLLYVSFTRAVEELYVWAPDPRKKDGKVSLNKVNALAYQVLVENEDFGLSGSMGQQERIFEKGERTQKRIPEEEPAQIYKMETLPTYSWRGKLTIRSRANEWIKEFEGEVSEKINRGILIHGILEKIKLPEDTEQAVESFYQEGLLASNEKQELIDEIQEILELPEVRDWFSSQWNIRNEQEILMPDGTVFRPDRMLSKENEAVVVEYKTGQPEEKHKKQVQEYGNALKQLGFDEVKQYLLYVEEKKVEEVE